MKELLNGLEKLIKAFGEFAHLPKGLISEITFYILLFGFVLTLLNLSWRFIKFIILSRNQRKLNRDIHPYFSKSDVDRATRYYIPTKYQNVAPSEDDEPGRHYIASPKDQLIPLFLKKAFKFDKDDHRFYLVLADAGMGKTTLMINLLLAYKNQWKMPWDLPKYDIKLFPLGAPNILEKVKNIEKKDNTILLLDAFDEDIEALYDYEKRMKEILKVVHEFRVIVITSRTQFFPTEKEVPHKTGYFTFGNENKEIKFQKSYLSIFDDKDIKKYLRKRFSPFSILQKKYYKAYKIVKRSPNLMVRPMLLSHIEDLVKSKTEFEFGYQIYEVLINKWIEREASKPGIKGKYGSKEKYKGLLNEFSHKLAIDLYENKEKRGGYFISKDEGFRKDSALSLTDIEEDHLQLSEAEMRSKSLMNRNAEGQYKFSHKSVMEYFLAKEAVENADFFLNFNFEGNEAAKKFFSEMVFDKILFPELIKCDGEFSIHNSKFKPLNQLRKSDFGKIKTLTVKNSLNNLDPVYLSCLETLEELTVFDKDKYMLLYQLYILYIYFWPRRERRDLPELRDRLELLDLRTVEELRDWGVRLELRDLRDLLLLEVRLDKLSQQNLLDQLGQQDLRDQKIQQDRRESLDQIINWLDQTIGRDLLDPRGRLDKIDRIEDRLLISREVRRKRQERRDLQKLLDLLASQKLPEDEKIIKGLGEINLFLNQMKMLENRLPNCKVYY